MEDTAPLIHAFGAHILASPALLEATRLLLSKTYDTYNDAWKEARGRKHFLPSSCCAGTAAMIAGGLFIFVGMSMVANAFAEQWYLALLCLGLLIPGCVLTCFVTTLLGAFDRHAAMQGEATYDMIHVSCETRVRALLDTPAERARCDMDMVTRTALSSCPCPSACWHNRTTWWYPNWYEPVGVLVIQSAYDRMVLQPRFSEMNETQQVRALALAALMAHVYPAGVLA